MDLKYLLIVFILLILSLIILYPHLRAAIYKWNLNYKKRREAEIEIQNQIAKQKREIESARIAKIRAVALKENEERLKIAKEKQVNENNAKLKTALSGKYINARIHHEVQYTGAYRIPIADYSNYDLNIQGISFFIDNLKFIEGRGQIEVRHYNFEDVEFDIYNLEMIDGFAILNQRLKSKSTLPRKDHSSTYRQVYLTIRENSFEGINSGIVHKITYTPFSILDWK
jgi:hypothetical protein